MPIIKIYTNEMDLVESYDLDGTDPHQIDHYLHQVNLSIEDAAMIETRRRTAAKKLLDCLMSRIDHVPAPISEPLTREERFDLDELKREMEEK